MSSGRSNSLRLGLRARLVLWTAGMLAVSLVAGFAWVHHGLRTVLEARNDAFLGRKAAELGAVVREEEEEGRKALEAEIRREVATYEAEGLVVIVRRPDRVEVTPPSAIARRLADRLGSLGPGLDRRTLTLSGSGERYRVLRTALAEPGKPTTMLGLGLDLAETETTLTQFDRRVAAGGLAFLALAVGGGLLLSRQALRPVADCIRTARSLNPADLSARLSRTGVGDELDQLAGTINELLDRLADYHAQVTRFTADASHELRSPLGALRAAIEVALQRPRAADEYREILGSLGEQCDRLTALVNGLLLLARADAGQIELRQESIDLAALAGEVAEMYQPLAEERGVALVCDWAGPVLARGDSARLRQLLTNLVDNAIKFTERDGRITIRVERIGAQARLKVIDTGVGISAEHLPHIFERFYQADPARAAGGTGLGLSICRWIAEAHGGSIHAARGPGQGSTFTVTIPTSASDPSDRFGTRIDGLLPERR